MLRSDKFGSGARRVNRRDLLGGAISAGVLAGGTPGWLRAARAQQPNVPVIGYLDAVWGRIGRGIGRGLAENGFVGGKDVITDTTPIVFLADDPVAAGLVDRLTQPGGNLTGVANLDPDLIAPKIEIARELVPATNLVVLVTDPTIKASHENDIRKAQAATNALGLELSIIAWSGESGFEAELAALPRDRKAMLVFGGGLPFFVQRASLAYLAVQYGFPAIYGFREAAEEGGLVSFGTRQEDAGHLMGFYAARILRGDKPADLPVQKLTRTELVINRWPAKALGLQIPSTLLTGADEVIE